MMSPLIAP